jgi:hypothetical protein
MLQAPVSDRVVSTPTGADKPARSWWNYAERKLAAANATVLDRRFDDKEVHPCYNREAHKSLRGVLDA